MAKSKKILSNWRVLLLLFVVVLSLVAIQPHFGGVDGVTIRSVGQNSSAANAGLTNPSAKLPPLAKERILSLNGQPVRSESDFYALQQKLDANSSVRIETNKQTYTALTRETSSGTIDLGLKVYNAPSTNLRKGLDLEGGTRVLLKPTEEISADELDLTINSLKERLNVYGLSDVVVRESGDLSGRQYILLEMAGVTENEVRELLAKQGKFEAKVNNESVFLGGKKDITYVCRSAECSGIDAYQGCTKSADGYLCRFFFAITLSPEAAERQAAITKNLGLVSTDSGSYLDQDLILYLDDVQVDQLRIGAELRGKPTTNIQISGSGIGRTEQEAITVALDNMKRLQTVIITGSLPVKLEIVKLDTISPTLGQDFLNNVMLVGVLALASVVSVVLWRYRRVKVVLPMVIILVSEMIMILGFAALVGWNLDLAAIAGIIIVAGTGVDHLIIITDETMAGKVETSWRQRIKGAMSIIFGAFFTVVAGMIPLFSAGAGLLKGFALTTIAGAAFGVLIARPAYAAIIEILESE
ncbi:hypothetical protein HY496_01565 [Candidatus Woesearchaeota archaeon]|nr:hypothetical protein [Candidatus Woesearchaeota archaeon]